MADAGNREGQQLEGLIGKLEEFGSSLDDEERAALTSLISGGAAPPTKGGVSAEEFKGALEYLRASRRGRIDVQRRKDDDGFWAQWAQRQY